MTGRLEAARRALEERSLDALLVWNLVNVRYLSGFTGSEGALVIAPDRAIFLTDSRYETQIRDEVPDFEHRIGAAKTEMIAAALRAVGAVRVGFEDETITVGRLGALRESAADVKWTALGDTLDTLRLIKSPQEVATLKKAAAVAEAAFEEALLLLRPGVREREVALAIDFAMRRAGASGNSFETIVASGPRGALPHGVASDRVVGSGELVVIDWGCVFEGYCSDETMTVAVGPVDTEAARVYDVVRRAQAAALEALRPGVELRAVDAVARGLIAEAGYGDFFGHGLGHGVGIEIHEGPRVGKTSTHAALEGMVVTVEPGIYLPGRFGVRIEDTVLVTDNGYERITTLDKALRRVA